MEEKVLLTGQADFSDWYREADKVIQKFEAIAKKDVKLKAIFDGTSFVREVKNVVAQAQQELNKLSAKASPLTIAGQSDTSAIKAEFRQLEEYRKKLGGFGLATTAVGGPEAIQQLDKQIAEAKKRLETLKGNNSFDALRKSAESAGAKVEELQEKLKRVKEETIKSKEKLEYWIKTARGVEAKGNTPSERTQTNLDNAFKRLEAQKKELDEARARLNDAVQNKITLDKRLETAPVSNRAAIKAIEERVKALTKDKEIVEKLIARYKELGQTGRGSGRTKSNVDQQLGIINSLIERSDLLNSNERQRIDLFKAQARLLERNKVLLLDQVKAAKELYEAESTIGKGIGIYSTKGLEFGSANELIKKFAEIGENGKVSLKLDNSDFVNSVDGINLLISKFQEARNNVELGGDTFETLGSIIESLESRVQQALIGPIIEAKQQAQGLASVFYSLENLQIPTDFRKESAGIQGSNAAREQKLRNQERILSDRAAFSEERRQLAITPYNAEFADLQKERQKLEQERQRILRDREAAPFSISGESLPTDFRREEIATRDALRLREQRAALERRALLSNEKKQSAIVPFNQEFANEQKIQQEIIRANKLVDDRIKAFNTYIEKQRESIKLDQQAVAAIRTVNDAIEANKKARSDENRLVAGTPAFADANRRQVESQSKLVKTEFDKLLGRAEQAPFTNAISQLEELAGKTKQIPALVDLINASAKELSKLFAEGTDEAKRLKKVIESTKGPASSGLIIPRSFDDYKNLISQQRKILNSSEIGGDIFNAAGKKLGFTELEELDKQGAKLKAIQEGQRDYFKSLIAESGSAKAAVASIFQDFGFTPAGIDSAVDKLNAIKGALPISEQKAYQQIVDETAESLGISEQAASAAFRKSRAATKAAAEALENYNKLLRESAVIPLTPKNISVARKTALDKINKAVPGSDIALEGFSELGAIDFNQISGELANLQTQAEAFKKINFGDDFVQELQKIRESLKDFPQLLEKFDNTVKNKLGNFAVGSQGKESFDRFVKGIGGSGGRGNEVAATGSLRAYEKALEEARTKARTAAQDNNAFSKALAEVASAGRLAAESQRNYDKSLRVENLKLFNEELEKLKKSGKGFSAFLEDVFAGDTKNQSGVKARLNYVTEFARQLEQIPDNVPLFDEVRSEVSNLQQQLNQFSINNIESELLDLGDLFKSLFAVGLNGNTPGLLNPAAFLADFRKGPLAPFKGLQQRAGALNPTTRRGISEALIGGGFPLLFGQGLVPSAGGALGGLLGPAILGGAGGFAGGIVGTAIGQALADTAQSAGELSKAMVSPIDNLQALADAAALSSRRLAGTAAGLAERGRFAAAGAIVLKDISQSQALSGVREIEQYRESDQFTGIRRKGAELRAGLGTGLSFFGDIYAGIASELISRAPGIALIRNLAGDSGQKKAQQEAVNLDKRASEFEELLARKRATELDLARREFGKPATKRIAELNDEEAERNLELQSLRDQKPLASKDKQAQFDEKINQLLIDQAQARELNLAKAVAATDTAQRQLEIEEKISKLGSFAPNATRDAFSSYEERKRLLDDTKKAEAAGFAKISSIGQELYSLNSQPATDATRDRRAQLEQELKVAKAGVEAANEQYTLAEKEWNVRLRGARQARDEAKIAYDFAAKTSVLQGASLQAANEQEAYDAIDRRRKAIKDALKQQPGNTELKLQFEQASLELKKASLDLVDNSIRAGEEFAQRVIRAVQASRRLGNAEEISNLLGNSGPRTGFVSDIGAAKGALEAQGITEDIFSSVESALSQLVASQADLASAVAAAERTGQSADKIDPAFQQEVAIAGANFKAAVIEGSNKFTIAISDAVGRLIDSQNSLARNLFDPRAAVVFGGPQQARDMAANIATSALEGAKNRFKQAYGFGAFPGGGDPNQFIGNDPSQTAQKVNFADYINKLVGSTEQVRGNQELISALTANKNAFEDANINLSKKAEVLTATLEALVKKDWVVDIIVNNEAPARVALG